MNINENKIFGVDLDYIRDLLDRVDELKNGDLVPTLVKDLRKANSELSAYKAANKYLEVMLNDKGFAND